MSTDQDAHLLRALTSLESLSVGDACEDQFFVDGTHEDELIAARTLLEAP